MKITGSKPLALIPFKGDYVKNDWKRLARFMNVPWELPEHFPIAALSASRAFYWLVDENPSLAKRLALAIFESYFGYGRDITDFETLADIAEPLGVDKEKSARFSFLMVVPLILGKMLKDILSGEISTHDTSFLSLIIGFCFAFITGIIACKWMIRLVKNSKLTYFAYYCFTIGGVVVIFSVI
mgnify:CR=1 FL=1